MKVSRKKIIFCILYSIIAILGMGSLIFAFRIHETTSSQQENFEQKRKNLDQAIDDMEAEKKDLLEQYDLLYESKSEAIALLAKETSLELTDDLLLEIKNAMNVENCIVTDLDGNVIASAQETKIDFTSSRYNMLRAAVTDPISYAPMTVDFTSGSIRFYASNVNDKYIGIVCVATEELEKNIENNTSLESVLAKIHVGQNGFVAAVDDGNYEFLYYPDEKMIGQNVLNEGVDAECLVDGYEGYITIGGEKYYCSVMVKNDAIYILAVPKSEIIDVNFSTTIFTGLILAIVLILLIFYYIFSENERRDMTEAIDAKKGYLDKVTAKKMNFPAVLGIFLIFLCTCYFQLLFNMSSQSVTNNARIKEAISVIEENNTEKERLTSEYDQNYLEKCQIAAYVIGKVEAEKTLTQEFMISLKEALKVEEIWYLDLDGKTIASDQDFWSWQLSPYKGDQSYDFWMVLEGQMPYLIQDPCINDYGYYSQYIGVAMMDDTHHSKGMVQIGLLTDTLETKLMNNTLQVILKKIQIGNSGFAFAVNKKKKTFDYYSDSDLIGKSVENYGMNSSDLKSGFMDFVTIDGVEYYATSLETKKDYIYVAVPYAKIVDGIFTLSFVAVAYAAVAILLFWFLLSYVSAGTKRKLTDSEENEQLAAMKNDAGLDEQSKNFITRFNSSQQHRWNQKTAGQKIAFIFNVCVTIFSVILLYVFYNADTIFKEDSLILYIMNGNWQRKLNIFSVTSCIIAVVIVNIIVNLLREVLNWLSNNVNAKMLTIIRLINNSLKFAAAIGCIYYCLGLIGVDTKTLVTSAGILTLIVGLGANSLVNDIISGLFLILEGDFQVGDIVTIDGFRGTVQEIGIRTVKVQEGSGNVKVISNRNASNVLNMTKHDSVIAINMSIEYGENLEYVEYVLAKELPLIKNKFSQISDGPYYKGVSALGDNSVDILIVCNCKEEVRIQLDRDLRRELKLLFDRYGINIPYPQVVVNEPCSSFHQVPSMEKKEKETAEADIAAEKNDELV